MKKIIAVTGVLAVLALLAGLAMRFGSRMHNVDWEKRLEAMPENAPPKWMFRNISDIRQNTDRILDLLEQGAPSERSLDTHADKPAT